MPDDSFSAAAAAMAREAGALLMQHFLARVAVEYKGEADVVTVADRAAEQLLVQRLRARWPEHQILAEEGSAHKSASEYRWYVDPLDGTTNFAHGYPVFCVSMGLEHRGELIAGVLYDPSRDEMFTAEKGSGAFLNGGRIQVSSTSKLAESLLGTGFPSKKRHKNPNIHFYQTFTLRSHGVRRAGSAALDLASVACGRFDGFWEFNLNPWDTAAGVLLVREAGGTVTNFSGGPFDISSREVLASNGRIHEQMLATLAEVFSGKTESLPIASDRQK